MDVNTQRAEAALAALSFVAENVSFDDHPVSHATTSVEHNQDSTEGKEGSISRPIESKDKREVTVLKEKHVETDLIPDWTDAWCPRDYESPKATDDEQGDTEESVADDESSRKLSWLEDLGTDLSSLVLSHLSVQELARSVSLVSRAMKRHSRSDGLWRLKFAARWNANFMLQSHSASGTWYSSYQEAYANPHDLWMTHWNCVYPDDSDSPGRCCIPMDANGVPDKENIANDDDNYRSSWMNYCPTCRYQSGAKELPLIAQHAMEEERKYQESLSGVDPVERAETVGAAHGLLFNDKHCKELSNSRAKAIFASTQYSIAKFCRQAQTLHRLDYQAQDDQSSQDRVQRARRAFLCASTFHRQIRPQQYQTYGLHFLTDALFFNVGRSQLDASREGLAEMNNLRQDVYGETDDPSVPSQPGTISNLGHKVETSHHTWHIVRFTNPDFTRPLSFRIFVERPDCFTVFPSEGYLEPGHSCHIVLGVRPLGSLLSEAFEALNVLREEVDPFLADVYSTEAHLPYAPYAVRYMFAPATPCIPPSFTSRGDIRSSQTFVRPTWTQTASSKYKHVVQYLWDNVATEGNVRTQYLSAHVNANYGFSEFQRATLFPFYVHVRESDQWGTKDNLCLEPLVFVAPNVLHQDPALYDVLHNLQETELSDSGVALRTEKACYLCGRDWGPRSEELGRAHILRKLICDVEGRKRNRLMSNLVECVRSVYAMVDCKCAHTLENVADTSLSTFHRAYELLHSLHAVLLQKRAEKLVTVTQRGILMRLECIVDNLCGKVQEELFALGEEVEDHQPNSTSCLFGNEWRNAGVYRHITCTDSVFGDTHASYGVDEWNDGSEYPTPAPLNLPASIVPLFKDEPYYLDGFRHLCHSPGLYCLGRQEDPNHDGTDINSCETRSLSLNRRFYRRTWDRHTDIYMDNQMFAFASALSMIHDPRSLLVHGVYDRVQYPGSVVRRPLLPDIHFHASRSCRDNNDLARRAEMLIAVWKEVWRHSRENHRVWEADDTLGYGSHKKKRFCLHMNDVDLESHQLVHLSLRTKEERSVEHISSVLNFIHNVPPPGVGQFSLSHENEEGTDVVAAVSVFTGTGVRVSASEHGEDTRETELQQPAIENPPNEQNQNRLAAVVNGNLRGPRILNIMFLLSAHLGWSVDESQGSGSTMVDRRILIATQWVSNSLMALPLITTLIARCTLLITPKPIDYHLEGLPYEVYTGMRYFTGMECVSAALVVTFLWLVMGRYSERSIGRSSERAMMDQLPESESTSNDPRFVNRIKSRFFIWCQRQWDRVCPLFLQRLVFTPRWNRRRRREFLNHFVSWRSKDLREHRSVFRSDSGRGVSTFVGGDGRRHIETTEESSTHKFLIGIVISLGSFCTSSPHFFLNLLTVFYCSIGLGMSMSLQSMEMGRGVPSVADRRPLLRPFGLNTLVIAFVLIGQLVGSSGGVLFLAEFVVTTVSLVLGGAGTISAAAMESWAVFFMLSSTAFWGYLFARVALMDGMRYKRRGFSSLVLCTALLLATGLWIGALCVWEWEIPTALMIVRASLSREHRTDRKYLAQHLQ